MNSEEQVPTAKNSTESVLPSLKSFNAALPEGWETAGLTYIKKRLKYTEEWLARIKANSICKEFIDKYSDRVEEVPAISSRMILRSLQSLYDLMEEATDMVNVSHEQPSTEMALSEQSLLMSPEEEKSFEKTELQASNIVTSITPQKGKKERKKAELAMIFHALYILIVTLHNMKMKHVKSKNTLSVKTLDKLRKPIQGYVAPVGQLEESHTSFYKSVRDLSGTLDKDNNQLTFSQRCKRKPMQLAGEETRPRRNPSVFRQSFSLDQTEIDTWDKLISAGQVPHGNAIIKSMQQPRSQRRSSVRHSFKGSMIQDQSIPIWQIIGCENAIKLGRRTNTRLFPFMTAVHTPEKQMLGVMKDNWNQAKIKKANDVIHEMDAKDRIKLFTFRKILTAADKSKYFHLLRKTRVQGMQKLSSKLVVTNLVSADWFEMITEKCIEIFGENSPEIRELLTELYLVSDVKIKSFPFIKAKMCLLIFSLPAYEILQIHFQKAIQFLLVHVLEEPSILLEQWLKKRKMPVVVVESQGRGIF